MVQRQYSNQEVKQKKDLSNLNSKNQLRYVLLDSSQQIAFLI